MRSGDISRLVLPGMQKIDLLLPGVRREAEHDLLMQILPLKLTSTSFSRYMS
jgi:hypothetical protein